jgi:glyoxylase-like metal-dependent hydrolase (beta-lactamase superfamily II)
MQLTPAIHALRHLFRIPVAPGIALDRFVYSYVLAGETITLIDTGVAGCEKTIFDYLRSIGRDPREISLIILTHSHPDHIGAAKAIRDTTGCSIMAHPSERGWVENVERQNRERPVPGFSALVGGSVPLDHEISDGDVIDTDGTESWELQVIHTPGHSDGSISLLYGSGGALFCGDAVPVPGDIPVYDDAAGSARSIQKLKAVRGIRSLLSAWDEPRGGDDAYRQMDRALLYLQQVRDATVAASAGGTREMMEVTRQAAAALGLPPQAVSPLLARTIAATLQRGGPARDP